MKFSTVCSIFTLAAVVLAAPAAKIETVYESATVYEETTSTVTQVVYETEAVTVYVTAPLAKPTVA